MIPIKITPRAAEQIEAAANWWRANRPSAPGALVFELEKAVDFISRQPQLGAPVTNAKLRGVRQLHLGRVHYLLYYRVRAAPRRIEILALWHASRGQAPGI